MADVAVNTDNEEIINTNSENSKQDVDLMNSIASKVADNKAEPSTPFIVELDRIYNLPRGVIINSLETQIKDLTHANKFRDQMFSHFLGSFDQETLDKNGFIITAKKPEHHLKLRRTILNFVVDAYDFGQCVHELVITNRLAKKLFNTTPSNPASSQEIPDNATILQKLQEVLELNTKITTQYKDLQNHLTNVERDNTLLKQHVAKIERKLDELLLKDNSVKSCVPSPPLNVQPQEDVRVTIPSIFKPNISPSFSNIVQSGTKSNDASKKKVSFSKKTPTINRKVVYGGKSNAGKNVSGVTRPYSLFVGGFDLRLSKEETKRIIENEMNITVLDITQIRRNNYNQSFKVDINFFDKEKSFESNRWFEGLVVKPYRQPRKDANRNHTDDFIPYNYANRPQHASNTDYYTYDQEYNYDRTSNNRKANRYDNFEHYGA